MRYGTCLAKSMAVRRYQDLVCWQLSMKVKREVYAITDREVAKKDVKVCDQIRDSGRSAPRSIAEGFGRYRPAEFAHYLEIARGSLMETDNHLRDALDCRYVTKEEHTSLCRLVDRAIGATTKLIVYLKGKGRNH